MKQKLFSGSSLLISLKAIASNIVVYLSALPLWILMYWLIISKQMYVLAGIVGVLIFLWHLLFFGYLNRIWWKWK